MLVVPECHQPSAGEVRALVAELDALRPRTPPHLAIAAEYGIHRALAAMALQLSNGSLPFARKGRGAPLFVRHQRITSTAV
jgi:hypothetical protein